MNLPLDGNGMEFPLNKGRLMVILTKGEAFGLCHDGEIVVTSRNFQRHPEAFVGKEGAHSSDGDTATATTGSAAPTAVSLNHVMSQWPQWKLQPSGRWMSAAQRVARGSLGPLAIPVAEQAFRSLEMAHLLPSVHCCVPVSLCVLEHSSNIFRICPRLLLILSLSPFPSFSRSLPLCVAVLLSPSECMNE